MVVGAQKHLYEARTRLFRMSATRWIGARLKSTNSRNRKTVLSSAQYGESLLTPAVINHASNQSEKNNTAATAAWLRVSVRARTATRDGRSVTAVAALLCALRKVDNRRQRVVQPPDMIATCRTDDDDLVMNNYLLLSRKRKGWSKRAGRRHNERIGPIIWCGRVTSMRVNYLKYCR